MTFGTNQMVMVGNIYIKASGVIDMMNSLNQTIFLKRRYRSVNGIDRYGLEVFAHQIENVSGGRMIGIFNKSPENFSPLMGYSQAFGFTDSFEVFHHPRNVFALIFHIHYNLSYCRIVPI